MIVNDTISIIMPVYNTEKYIEESIESVLSQTYKDFELIIVDDGSTDATVSKIHKYNDKRIKLFLENHKGFIPSLNIGLEKSTGYYIGRMDGDDLIDKDKLKLQIEFLKNNKDISLVGTNFYYIDEKGNKLTEKKLPEKCEDIEFMMPIIPSVNHGSILTYRHILDSVGGYSEEYYCEDVVLFMKLLSQGYKMYNIQLPLYLYRIIEKPPQYLEKHYKDYYIYSKIYLNDYYSKSNEKKINPEFIFRMGLLEYYIGSIKEARKLFIKCLKHSSYRNKILFRYLPITLLGDRIIKKLRGKKITEKMNFIISNKIKYDTNYIEPVLNKK